MKVVYWVAAQTDRSAYREENVRARTKKECQEMISTFSLGTFEAPKKIVVEYKDAFDLVQKLSGVSKPYEGVTG